MAYCPKCLSTNVRTTDIVVRCLDCDFVVSSGSPFTDPESKPPARKPGPPERISLASAKRDIGNAFSEGITKTHWDRYSTYDRVEKDRAELVAGQVRVLAFLAQVEAREAADQRQPLASATIDDLVAEIRRRLAGMSSLVRRVDLFEGIEGDYCRHCGADETAKRCTCSRDD